MKNTDVNESGALPVRQRLSHIPPVNVTQYIANACYFITICVNRSHYNISPYEAGRVGPLTSGMIGEALFDAIEFRHKNSGWIPHMALIMPDHVHMIIAFCPSVEMSKTIANFKRYVARRFGLVWQKGFFDHRLRNDAEYAEKWRYVEMNPVANGLCPSVEEWPFRRIWRW